MRFSAALRRTEQIARAPHVRLRVLLVEDNRSDVILISKLLRDASQEDTFAISAVPRLADAMETLDEKKFDMVLLDLTLLDADGVSCVAALRHYTKDTVLIVYSGTYDPQTRQEAILCGARYYLVKGRDNTASLRFMIDQVKTQRP